MENANTVVIEEPGYECRVESMRRRKARLEESLAAELYDLKPSSSFSRRGIRYPKQTEVILEAVRLLGINAEKNWKKSIF